MANWTADNQASAILNGWNYGPGVMVGATPDEAAMRWAAAITSMDWLGRVYTLPTACSVSGSLAQCQIVCSAGGCDAQAQLGRSQTVFVVGTDLGEGGASSGAHTLTNAEYSLFTSVASVVGSGGGSPTPSVSPFSMSTEDAIPLALAIAGLWALAFCFRAIKQVIADSNPPTQE